MPALTFKLADGTICCAILHHASSMFKLSFAQRLCTILMNTHRECNFQRRLSRGLSRVDVGGTLVARLSPLLFNDARKRGRYHIELGREFSVVALDTVRWLGIRYTHAHP